MFTHVKGSNLLDERVNFGWVKQRIQLKNGRNCDDYTEKVCDTSNGKQMISKGSIYFIYQNKIEKKR